MQSKNSLYYHAKKAISENPEIIEALMEFERTKKLPKTTYKKRVDITIDEMLLRKFKAFCAEKGTTMSGFIERLIIDALTRRT